MGALFRIPLSWGGGAPRGPLFRVPSFESLSPLRWGGGAPRGPLFRVPSYESLSPLRWGAAWASSVRAGAPSPVTDPFPGKSTTGPRHTPLPCVPQTPCAPYPDTLTAPHSPSQTLQRRTQKHTETHRNTQKHTDGAQRPTRRATSQTSCSTDTQRRCPAALLHCCCLLPKRVRPEALRSAWSTPRSFSCSCSTRAPRGPLSLTRIDCVFF